MSTLPFSWQIPRACKVIHAGGIIAYPTDTLYGLGCDPNQEQAVTRLLTLKRRSVSKGLILIAAEAEQFSRWLEPKWQHWLAQQHPEQPTSYIVPCLKQTPTWLTGGRDTLALRLVGESVARQLVLRCGALVSTSANLSGAPQADHPSQLTLHLSGCIDMILSGPAGSGTASWIVDAISAVRLR